jgi:hypothetical protein
MNMLQKLIRSGSAWISFGFGSIQRGKMTHKSAEISSFEVLDVLLGGMKTSPAAWTSFAEVQGGSALTKNA